MICASDMRTKIPLPYSSGIIPNKGRIIDSNRFFQTRVLCCLHQSLMNAKSTFAVVLQAWSFINFLHRTFQLYQAISKGTV